LSFSLVCFNSNFN